MTICSKLIKSFKYSNSVKQNSFSFYFSDYLLLLIISFLPDTGRDLLDKFLFPLAGSHVTARIIFYGDTFTIYLLFLVIFFPLIFIVLFYIDYFVKLYVYFI